MTRCLCALLASALIAVLPAQTPTGHWRLDDASGTTAVDASPNGNTGTLVGFGATPWTVGVHGGALQFAAGQQVDIALTAGLPMYDTSGSPFTFACWVNGPPQDDDRIYSEGSTVAPQQLYTIGSGRNSNTTSDRLQLFVRNDAGAVLVNAQGSITVFDSTWHHVAVVDEGGQVSVYVDGVLDPASFNYTPTGTNSNVDRVALGAVVRATTCCNYTGMMDDVRLYPFALSSVDIATVLNDQPLIAGFQVNQPGASMVVDGKVGSVFSAAPVDLALGQMFDMTLSSTLAGNPWELGVDVGTAIPNAAVYSNNIINMNLGSATISLLNGGFQTSSGVAPVLPPLTPVGGTVTSTIGLTAPGVATTIALQFGLLDPTSPDGFATGSPANINVQ